MQSPQVVCLGAEAEIAFSKSVGLLDGGIHRKVIAGYVLIHPYCQWS